MIKLSFIGYIIGGIFIIHSGISSYEYNHFIKSTSTSGFSLPLDIKIECILGLFICIIATFHSLQIPKSQNYITGEKFKSSSDSSLFRLIDMKKATIDVNKSEILPFEFIENRKNFIDINLKRAEFQKWLNSK